MLLNKLSSERVTVSSYVLGERKPLVPDAKSKYISVKLTTGNTITFEYRSRYCPESVQRVKLPVEFFSEEVEIKMENVSSGSTFLSIFLQTIEGIHMEDMDFSIFNRDESVAVLSNKPELKAYAVATNYCDETLGVTLFIVNDRQKSQVINMRFEDFELICNTIREVKSKTA